MFVNATIWAQVVSDVRASATKRQRNDWLNALNKIERELADGTLDAEYVGEHTAKVESKKSGHTYISNGVCYDERQHACQAYSRGLVCKHRVLAHLMSIYYRRVEERQQVMVFAEPTQIPVMVDGKLLGYASTEAEADQTVSRILGYSI